MENQRMNMQFLNERLVQIKQIGIGKSSEDLACSAPVVGLIQ